VSSGVETWQSRSYILAPITGPSPKQVVIRTRWRGSVCYLLSISWLSIITVSTIALQCRGQCIVTGGPLRVIIDFGLAANGVVDLFKYSNSPEQIRN
jgi:hypothetical protein